MLPNSCVESEIPKVSFLDVCLAFETSAYSPLGTFSLF